MNVLSQSRGTAVLAAALATALGWSAACQPDRSNTGDGSGGAAGRTASGGAVGSGAVTATGGGFAAGSGGASASGGFRGSGGSTGSGGSQAGASGGSNASGGVSATGGIPEGGGSGHGGNGSGGTSATGGASARGGATGSAGTTGAAGHVSTGMGGGAGGALAPGALLEPAHGALLGAFVGTGTQAALETTLGRKLAVVHSFFGWTDDWTAWVGTVLAAGQIPLVTWETWTNSVGIPLDDILAGAHDTMIRARAQSAKNAGKKFLLRWGHEMNGNWYPWDGAHNGANPAAAMKYVAVYRHIHDLFVSAGATNVLWVFSPNVDSVPGEAWNQWDSYYPGDTYADWMAFDGYNWGTVQTGSSWRSFSSITGAIYAGLAAKGKPIMIPETASTEMGGDKAAWITGILPALRDSYPAIKALVWFHMNKETDWRVDSSAAARSAFVALARDPYLNP